MYNNLIPKADNLINTKIDNSKNYTLIEIDEKIYAVNAKQVLEIIKILDLDYFKQMPSYILGIAKYNDEPVGVIDLREVFKSERITYDLSAKIIFIKTQEGISSIICDKVLDIKKLDDEKIHELPYQAGANFFDGLYINDEENIYILNMDNVKKYLETSPKKYQNEQDNQSYIVDDEQSKEILKERKNFIAKISQVVQNDTPLYDMGVSFTINNVKYYINMASVKEFFKVNNSKFIKIPCTKDYILGLINIKGDYITVLDIRRFYNNSKTEVKEKSTIIILNSPEFKIGILADEICESLNIDFDKIIQNRLQKQEESKTIEFVKDGEIYQIIDVEKLLQDDKLTICWF